MNDFQEFPKIARLTRPMVITEKLDGTNGQIFIDETGTVMKVGSRNRWLSDSADNFGFYKWAMENRDELLKLGPGRHYGEWWGPGIQRGYGIAEKRFSLFNVSRWYDPSHVDSRYDRAGQNPGFSILPLELKECPQCCSVVPVLFRGIFNTGNIETTFQRLSIHGSKASPGFMRPEGIIIFHEQGRISFKKTFENDEQGKGQ